jgi:hypothetical protein
MTEDKKKKKPLLFLISAGAVLLLLLIPVTLTLFNSNDYIITYKDDRVVRGKKLFICGDTVICMKGSVEDKDKSKLPERMESVYSLSILSLKELRLIEIEQPDDEAEVTVGGPVDIKYLGNFKIQLQGYTGKLRLYKNKEKISGTVRFPDWANGKVEYLKNIRISGDRISFTRSATTEAEVRRLGASSRFTQRFTGRYSDGGRYIKGYLVNHRKERHQWDAARER